MWKRLEHENIVRLLGVTPTPRQLISEWMPGGDLTVYIKEHPDAHRLGLVGVPFVILDSVLTPATSYLVWLAAFTTSTRAV